MGWFDENHSMGACAQGECTCCFSSRNYENRMGWDWGGSQAQGRSQARRSFAWEDRYKKGDRKCSKCAVMKTSKVRRQLGKSERRDSYLMSEVPPCANAWFAIKRGVAQAISADKTDFGQNIASLSRSYERPTRGTVYCTWRSMRGADAGCSATSCLKYNVCAM